MMFTHPKRGFLFPFLIILLLSPCWSSHAQSLSPTEYEVKAAFLYNFAKFVEWPPEAFKNSGDTFVIGILGEDPFEKNMEQDLSGKTVQDKKLVFKQLSGVEGASDCHILFISSSEEGRLRPLLSHLKTPPVLTVGDNALFVQRGGMVGFILEDKRVRFVINVGVAENAGLKISSQLLKLAKTVEGRPSIGGTEAP